MGSKRKYTNRRLGFSGGIKLMKAEVLKAVREASISVSCLLDDIPTDTNFYKDMVHIQNQITTIEKYFEEVDDE